MIPIPCASKSLVGNQGKRAARLRNVDGRESQRFFGQGKIFLLIFFFYRCEIPRGTRDAEPSADKKLLDFSLIYSPFLPFLECRIDFFSSADYQDFNCEIFLRARRFSAHVYHICAGLLEEDIRFQNIRMRNKAPRTISPAKALVRIQMQGL